MKLFSITFHSKRLYRVAVKPTKYFRSESHQELSHWITPRIFALKPSKDFRSNSTKDFCIEFHHGFSLWIPRIFARKPTKNLRPESYQEFSFWISPKISSVNPTNDFITETHNILLLWITPKIFILHPTRDENIIKDFHSESHKRFSLRIPTRNLRYKIHP